MSGLAALFSAETLQKFERKSKPVEFSSKRKEPVYVEREPDNFNESTETVGVEGKNKAKKRKRNEVDGLVSRGDGDDRSADNEEEGAQQAREKVVRPVNHAADECTLFVGNIPTDQTIKSISALFSKFGEVESVRLRSVPTAGTAVDDAGNQSKVKQICVRKGLFGSQKGSFNAYIVFKSRESVEAAMTLNNTVIGARHIRCDRVPPTLFDPKLSVFVGSVHLYADEEQLRTHFGAALANGADDIQSVRIVRDPETLVGKGIAYVLFKSAESVVQALSLHGKAFKKRELRVSTCGKRTKRTEARRTGADPSEKKAQQEKRFAESDAGISRQNAMKRLEKKDLSRRSSSAKKPVNKGAKNKKRMGGVVKRALKGEVKNTKK